MIITIFHLLPSTRTRVKFLELLIRETMSLESNMSPHSPYSYFSSPYRRPLLKFFNCHPKGTVLYALERLADPVFMHLFRDILAMDIAKRLREELCSNPVLLLTKAGLQMSAPSSTTSTMPPPGTHPPAAPMGPSLGISNMLPPGTTPGSQLQQLQQLQMQQQSQIMMAQAQAHAQAQAQAQATTGVQPSASPAATRTTQTAQSHKRTRLNRSNHTRSRSNH